MSRLAIIAAVLALGAVAAGAAALLAAGEAPAGALAWAGRARVVTPPALPGDRVVYGQVRNDGLRAVTLRAADVRVLDGAGRALVSDARFLQAYGPGGRAVTLAPGRTAPLTVAWRGRGARKVTIGAVTLPIP